MKRAFAIGAAAVLLWAAVTVPAFAGFFPLPHNGAAAAVGVEIGVTANRVSIRVKNQPLSDVLQRIQNETGIRFELQDRLAGERITANVSAADWKGAILALLKDYSKVQIWTANLGGSRLRIMTGGQWRPVTARQTLTQEPPVAYKEITMPEEPRARAEEAPVEAMSAAMLPPHLLFEPGLIQFLLANGVKVPPEYAAISGPAGAGSHSGQTLPMHLWHEPALQSFLQTNGIKPPGNTDSGR